MSFPKIFKGSIQQYAIAIIFLSGLIIRLLAAQADPFLHDWDERFHALVARNMMERPFVPMLKTTTLLSYDDLNAWCCNHIWLHKQPLFLWQMALSMKIFGVSELSMRLPSVLMGSIMILLLYRITILLTDNKTTALIAAALLSFSHFHLVLITGIKGMDHNDVAFGFYVLAAFWAYAEYTRSGKWTWAVLIGIFSGCAILNKWLTGLMVFLAWGFYLLPDLRHKKRKEIVQFIVSLIICGIIFLPWQFYIFHRFPVQAAHEAAHNTRHLFEAVEGHAGGIWFYLHEFPLYFGDFLWWGIFPGMLLVFFIKNADKRLSLSILLTVLFVFSFFSFLAKTKVDAYFFVIAPLCMIFIAVFLNALYTVFHKKYVLAVLCAAAVSLSLNIPEMRRYYSADNEERNRKIYNTEIYKNVEKYIPGHVKIVIGVNSFENVELMFYNNDITANHWWITPQDADRLAAMKIPVAVFKNHAGYIIPDFILKYPYLYIIDKELK